VRKANKVVTSRVLARDKLVGVLRGVIKRRYGDAVDLRYGYQVDPISFGNEEEKEEEAGRIEVDDVKGSGPPVKLRVSCFVLVSSQKMAKQRSAASRTKMPRRQPR